MNKLKHFFSFCLIVLLSSSIVFSYTGETETTGYDGSKNYTEIKFLEDGVFEIPTNVSSIDVLVVAGGGGGGGSYSGYGRGGGGGGAGGLVFIENYNITKYTDNISVDIGSGGSGGTSVSQRGSNGQDTIFGYITAVGGGGGGASDSSKSGLDGGSGGGAGVKGYWYGSTGGASTQNTTNDGYENTGYGSAGQDSTSLTSAGWGGGASTTGRDGKEIWNNTYATGGRGEDGGVSGSSNTGNGGGGDTSDGQGNGGSGIIVIRYYEEEDDACAYSSGDYVVTTSCSIEDLTVDGDIIINGGSLTITGDVIKDNVYVKNGGSLHVVGGSLK